MELYYVACFMAVAIVEIQSLNIEKKINEYFESDTVRYFRNTWDKYKRPIENAILRAMQENYGHKAMNVYVRRMQDPYRVSKGYCHSDNQVQIALADLELDDLPYLWMPEVNFLLPSNMLHIGATLSKMIIRSNYVVFRNKSQLIYDVIDQNIYESSPFRFQQVQTMGELGISIEGCIITGMAVTALLGSSVTLRFNSFKLSKCQYTFEIFTPGLGSPPVVAKYYPTALGLNLEQLVMKSLRQELMPKLQAAMYSFVNTTAIFEDKLPELRHRQEELFTATIQFMNAVIRNLNKITMEKNSGVVNMADFKLLWNDTFDDSPMDNEIILSKMVLSGLETAYSSHVGGSYKQIDTQIGEEIRFSVLRVRGNVTHKGENNKEYQFIAEIQDVAVEVFIDVEMAESRKEMIQRKSQKNQYQFQVTGWRGLEFAVPMSHSIYTDALLTGYLLNVIPNYITEHLMANFDKALESVDRQEGTSNNEKHVEDDHIEKMDRSSDREVAGEKNNIESDHEKDNLEEKHQDGDVAPEREKLIHYLDESAEPGKKLVGNEKNMIFPSNEEELDHDSTSPDESSEEFVNAGKVGATFNEISEK